MLICHLHIERLVEKYPKSDYQEVSLTKPVSDSLLNSTEDFSNSNNKHGPGARGRAKARAAAAAKAARLKESKQVESSQGKSKSGFFAEALTNRVFPNRPGNSPISSHPATSLSPSDFGKAQGGARITQCSAAEREIEENGPLEPSNQASSRERDESIQRSYEKPSQKDKKVSVTASDGNDYNLVETRERHQLSRHGDTWGIDDPVEVLTDRNGRPRIITRVNKENHLKYRQTVIQTLQDPESQIMNCRMRGTPAIGFYTTKYGGEFGSILVAPTEGPFKHDILKAQPLSALQLSRLREFGIID